MQPTQTSSARDANSQSQSTTLVTGSQREEATGAGAAGASSLGDKQGKSQASGTQRRPRRQLDSNAPKCIVSCIASLEACSDHLAECTDNIERRQLERAKQRRGGDDDPDSGVVPDPWWKQKGIIPLVAVILSWVYVVYVWRICAPAIRKQTAADSHPVRLANMSTGIGLLVGFNIIWLITVWSYIKVVLTPAGFANDYTEKLESPPPPIHAEWMEKGEGGPYLGPPEPEEAEQSNPMTQLDDNGDRASIMAVHENQGERLATEAAPDTMLKIDPEGQVNGDEHPVDPTLPAVLGPAGANVALGLKESQSQVRQHDQSHETNQGTFLPDESTGQTTTTVRPSTLDDHSRNQASLEEGQTEAASTDASPSEPRNYAHPTVSHGAIAGETVGSTGASHPPAQAYPPPNSGKIPKPLRQPPQPDYAPLAPANRFCYRCKHVKPHRAHHCRHCGKCVLKMDHHCPWVGGCVGARNHKFFFHFVCWVTGLEVYVVTSIAILFARGAQSRAGYEQWTIDGFVISLFPICVIFFLFTFSLLVTHAWLIVANQTTLEHLGFGRIKRREELLLSSYFSKNGQGGPGLHLKERRDIRKGWDREWGKLRWEINLWKVEVPDTAGTDAADGDDMAQERRPRYRRLSPFAARLANWKQTMGPAWWMWVLPLGRPEGDGLDYDVNPRHGPLGEWRRRPEWPEELR